jgi:antitoxin (DNA-binding transcriptional repressor) of toxin-antitoxin stability system
METIIGLKEFRSDVGKVASEVAKGRTFVVVRRSKPLFRVAPVEEEPQWETAADFTRIEKGGVNIKEILKRL